MVKNLLFCMKLNKKSKNDMKFTEQEAYEKLVAKLTNDGKKPLQASERTLKHLLTRYYKKFVDEETELDDFVKDNVDDFEEVNGNVNKDKADFAKEYQEKNKVEPQAPTTKAPENKDVENATVLEQIQAQLNQLIAERESVKRATELASKKAQLLAKMTEKGIKDEAWANKFLSKIDLEKVEDIETESTSYLEIYNKTQIPDAPAPTPSGTEKNKGLNPILSDVAKQIIRERENKSKI